MLDADQWEIPHVGKNHHSFQSRSASSKIKVAPTAPTNSKTDRAVIQIQRKGASYELSGSRIEGI